MPGCLGRIGPWDAGPGGREARPLTGTRCVLSLAPGSSLGMVSAVGAVAALHVAPGLGCVPQRNGSTRGPSSFQGPARHSPASDGGLPPGSTTLRGPAAPHGASVGRGQASPTARRTGRAPDEAQSAWQPLEPAVLPPTVVKLASGPVRVARVGAQAGSGDHLPSGYSCDQFKEGEQHGRPRAVAACSYCVVNVEDPEQAMAPTPPTPTRDVNCPYRNLGPGVVERAPEGPGRPRGAPHPELCRGGLPGLVPG